jgi:hypothetical protein
MKPSEEIIEIAKRMACGSPYYGDYIAKAILEWLDAHQS